jgi:hypothetical protein
MKFSIYNVTFLFCCLIIFNSCKKEEQGAVNTPSNQSETLATKAESGGINSESSSSNDKESSESLTDSTPNIGVNEPQIKQPEISIPQEPEEPEEENPITTPPSVTAFVAQMKENGVTKLVSELEGLEELGQESPGLAFEVLRELSAKTATLDPSSLPEDIKNEFETLSTGLRDIISHIETNPIPTEVMAEGREAIGAWWVEQSQADPDFEKDMGEVMRSWFSEMQELGSTLQGARSNMGELFEKYGIDDSELEN